MGTVRRRSKRFDYQSVCHCSKTEKNAEALYNRFDYQSVCHCSKTLGRSQCLGRWFDYQSVCHCSKTVDRAVVPFPVFDYQSVCHCSKTLQERHDVLYRFDYQSVCHCSKTPPAQQLLHRGFDYQSVCHCSKTGAPPGAHRSSLTTSQFVTAPKPLGQNPLCGRTDSRLAHSFMIEESPCQYTFFSRIRKPHRRERSQAAARSIPEKPPADRTLGPHLAPKNSSN